MSLTNFKNHRELLIQWTQATPCVTQWQGISPEPNAAPSIDLTVKSSVKNHPALPKKFQVKGTCKQKISQGHRPIRSAKECSLGRPEKISSRVPRSTVMFKAAILTPLKNAFKQNAIWIPLTLFTKFQGIQSRKILVWLRSEKKALRWPKRLNMFYSPHWIRSRLHKQFKICPQGLKPLTFQSAARWLRVNTAMASTKTNCPSM